ncbi:Putative odorant receptor 94a [Papilio xuthus]|uniref:Putative odorant receptor 94a n=1 Tax=Papilio xuthus TaxID=66420 RepID=A0A194PMT3_PAPXU|nr:Putative odorant receptor 94a [Papilio xuthus]
MHLYVLVCSINICCSVIQLNLDNVATSQKIWVFEYVSALSIQLFLLCWHSNEIKVESDRADRGVYESNWWKADPSERKQLLLLAGKLAPPYIMKAGPFTDLSIPTFIDLSDVLTVKENIVMHLHIYEKKFKDMCEVNQPALGQCG